MTVISDPLHTSDHALSLARIDNLDTRLCYHYMPLLSWTYRINHTSHVANRLVADESTGLKHIIDRGLCIFLEWAITKRDCLVSRVFATLCRISVLHVVSMAIWTIAT